MSLTTKEIATHVFPDFKGKTIRLMEHKEGDRHKTSSYWSGGSRDYYRILDVRMMAHWSAPEGVYPWTGPDRQGYVESLTDDQCLVNLSIMSKYKTITIHCTAAFKEKCGIEEAFHEW